MSRSIFQAICQRQTRPKDRTSNAVGIAAGSWQTIDADVGNVGDRCAAIHQVVWSLYADNGEQLR